jgi:MoaA/NifB/PqqE/SkfB family radical SAM enzyme
VIGLPVLGNQAPSRADAVAETATPWIGPHGRLMERLELHITYTCPERCVFCSEEHRMQRYKPYQVTFGRVATVLREHALRGVKNVHFTGGEPTIHPDFVRILRLAKKLKLRTSVGTIGTMLCREDFAAEALPYLDEALFSLHGPNAEVHDALAGRAGSFERVTRAISTVKRLKPSFGTYVNSVLTRQNAEFLPETAQLAESLGASLMVVSNLTPEGAGLDEYQRLTVTLEQLADVLPRTARAVDKLVLRFFGVPMCLLGPHRACSNDLHWDPRVTVEWASAPGKVLLDGFYNWAPDRKRVHVAACEGCSLRGVCMGVFDRYAELFPTSVLRPEREERA